MFFNIFNRLLVAKTCLRHESAVLSSLFRRKHFILWYSKKKNSARCVYKGLAAQVTRIQELDMRNYFFNLNLFWIIFYKNKKNFFRMGRSCCNRRSTITQINMNIIFQFTLRSFVAHWINGSQAFSLFENVFSRVWTWLI